MNEQAKAHFDHLSDLLKIEEEEDKNQYNNKVLKYSLFERKQQGITWYPLIIRESYYGVGERLIVELERPSDKHIPHQFQTGRTAALFSNSERGEKLAVNGVVSAVRDNQLRITLNVDELPDWAQRGKLGLDLLFDESSYKEMRITLNKVKKAEGRLAELRDILLGFTPANFKPLKEKVNIPSLNFSQNDAINNILSAEDAAIIHGPPGTGKTTTLIEAIIATLKNEKQVLVSAPSNNAVDLLTQKLSERGINVLRFGNPARISESLIHHSIDVKVTEHKDFKSIKELKKRASEFRNMASKYKRHFGREERNQRKALYDEAYKILDEANKIESYIVEDLIEKAQVITCTPVGSVNYLLRDRTFNTVFIDEAAQALEPASWIPITRAKKVIFAGDHFQLPPTVKSDEAARKGLAVTLFERTIKVQKADVMLKVQYRSNEEIMGFSSNYFYKNDLHADDSVKNNALAPGNTIDLLSKPVEFIDTAGCGFNETYETSDTSVENAEEADLLIKHLRHLKETMDSQNINFSQFSVGIISPYKAQVNILKEKFLQDEWVGFTNIAVNSVDGFQGQERDIIYISLVRSNSENEIGFLKDYRRMNVALTRAKKKLIIIGDSATLSTDEFYLKFLEYVEKIGAYKSAWEFV
ncbi:MAG TPA: AAA domain-containing protein [Cytophagales bacterium]|nr:AAA domain-containing protein [Cytophagales bacterium]